MDYPRMKLSQDARLTYLKTIVHAGNQLNGIRRKLQSLQKDTLLQLSKELKPLFQTKQKGSLQGNEDDELVDHDALYEQYKLYKQNKADALYLLEKMCIRDRALIIVFIKHRLQIQPA